MTQAANFFGETVGASTDKDELAGAAVAMFAEPFGERLGIEIFRGVVEQDDGGRLLEIKFFQGGLRFAHLSDFDGGEAADAFYVVVNDSAKFRAASFAKHDQAQTHLLEAVFLALFEEGFAADAQAGGGLADFVVQGFEGGGDDFALHVFE